MSQLVPRQNSPDYDSPLLVQELSRLARRKNRARRLVWWFGVPCAVLAGAAHLSDLLYHPVALLLLLLTAGPAIFLAYYSEATPYQNRVARALDRSITSGECGVEAIGPLAEAWQLERIDRETVLKALTRLLPLLEETSLGRLTPREREALYTTLHSDPVHNEEYLVTLLAALARASDVRALPHVQALRNGHPLFGTTAAVRAAVAACIESLEGSVKVVRLKETLLRPAEKQPEETLLRHASVEPADPATLLRAEDGSRSTAL